MLTELNYFSFCDYHPRLKTNPGWEVCADIKAGRQRIDRGIDYLSKKHAQEMYDFFGEGAVVVPVPRSTQVVRGGIWPSDLISNSLVRVGFAQTNCHLIERSEAVRKSSLSKNAKDRPSVAEHLESIRYVPHLNEITRIILVDDVVTAGRTSFACALKLQEFLPRVDVRLFAFCRTRSFISKKDAKTLNPSFQTISYNNISGLTWRND